MATCSHANLLRSADLLAEESEVTASSVFPDGRLFEGLVIDDYFSVERVGSPPAASASVRCLERASSAYKASDLSGSNEKDVVGADCAKVAGAELDASAPHPKAWDGFGLRT